MLEHELFKLLINLGEKLTKEEAKGLMAELCDPADAEGFMPFIRKYLFTLSYNLSLKLLSSFLERMWDKGSK